MGSVFRTEVPVLVQLMGDGETMGRGLAARKHVGQAYNIEKELALIQSRDMEEGIASERAKFFNFAISR